MSTGRLILGIVLASALGASTMQGQAPVCGQNTVTP
jgi:hypothetical protein